VEGAIDLTPLKLLSAARRKEIMARIHRDGALLLLCLMLGSTPLHAWNNEGHMVTAFIAYPVCLSSGAAVHRLFSTFGAIR
jgi:hypothetical protein